MALWMHGLVEGRMEHSWKDYEYIVVFFYQDLLKEFGMRKNLYLKLNFMQDKWKKKVHSFERMLITSFLEDNVSTKLEYYDVWVNLSKFWNHLLTQPMKISFRIYYLDTTCICIILKNATIFNLCCILSTKKSQPSEGRSLLSFH